MSDMPEQDVEALMSYLQPQNLSEDFEFSGSSMEEDFLPAMLDQEDSQPGQTVPFAKETEADIQLFNEPLPDLSRGLYDDLDTSADNGKGRAVEEQLNLDEHDNEFGYHEHRNSNQGAPLVNMSHDQYWDASSSYNTAPDYPSLNQPGYASLGYVHAGSDQCQFYGENPASSALAQNQASWAVSAPTAAGQISSRSIRKARKPAVQSTAPPKEKKPVKQSKKKCLAEVRDSESGLLWRSGPDQQWVPAVYHNDIWVELLEWTDQVATSHGGYDYPPAKGIENWNRTAFCLAQKSWARDRDNRPVVLFYIQKTDVADPPKPQDFFWHNRRVIDRDNLGMRWFNDLPATISSAVEDFRLDAIQKLNPNIEWEDIWGRTPNEFGTGKEPGIRTRPALTVPALSNRTLRFRREAGTLAWDRKDEIGNEIALEFFQNLMGEDCIQDNNTYAFGRDLRPEEVDRLDEYLRVEKLPERAQARRLRAAARVAAQRQAQAGPSNSQYVQQAPSTSHYGQQHQASIQYAPQPSANSSAHSIPRQPPAQVSRTGQGSSSSRFGASRFRQGFGTSAPSTSALNPANPTYGAPNQHGKRTFDGTFESRQSAATAKRPRVTDPGSVTHRTPEFTRDFEHPQLLQPRPFNPLKRSNVLPPNGTARGAQLQTFRNNATSMSTNDAQLSGHAINSSRKRVHEASDDEEEEGFGMHYKKTRIQQAPASQASGTRQTRRPAQRPWRPWRPSQALARSVGARMGTRAVPGPLNGSASNDIPTNGSRDSGGASNTAGVASDNVAPASNNGYMEITISVPIGSEVMVLPPNQTYNLVGMAIPGQNVEWKVIDKVASAASHGPDHLMANVEQEEGDPDWRGHQTTARSSKSMGNNHLPRAANPSFNGNTVKSAANDNGPPPGLPEDFVEEGFEPYGYENAVQYPYQLQTEDINLSSSTVGASFDTAQYPDQTQVENFDLSSSTLGAPFDTSPPAESYQTRQAAARFTGQTDVLDYEASASSPLFGGNLAATPEIDYFSQLNIPHYTTEELDQLLNEAGDIANASFVNDLSAHGDQNPTETFALPQADTSGASASGWDNRTYEQMQAEYEDTFGRPLFDIDYPLEDDVFGGLNAMEYSQDPPLVQPAEADVLETTRSSPSAEEVRVVPNAGGVHVQGASSPPTQGAACGSPKAQQETPATTIPSDPVGASEVVTDSYPTAATRGSDAQEPDWDELFGEGHDKEYVEEEL